MEAIHRYDVSLGILSTPPTSLKIMVVTMEFSTRGKAGGATHAPMSYELLISSIAAIHVRTRAGAAGAVNRYLTLRNWFIGAYIVEFEQNGEDRASYGQQLLPRLAQDLRRRGISGCSAEMLGRTRVFYRTTLN